MMEANKVFETQDGSHSIYSAQYGVSYHSKYGAIQESRHVFIEAGLYPLLSKKTTLHILEIGFGTGLNAFLTLLEAEKRKVKIHYTGLEAYPIPSEQAVQLNYPARLSVSAVASNHFTNFHRSPWGDVQAYGDYFTLHKCKVRFEEFADLDTYDLIYFDAFAPSSQPELWEEPVLRIMYDALCTNGVLVTYCAKGSVKRTLKALGFEVEKLAGPPGKREMTRAVKKNSPV